jgi:long-chain acyl-CoA synthetase
MVGVANLVEILIDSARRRGGEAAVRDGDALTSYRELDAASARFAGLLRERGLEPGDRVGLMLPNAVEFPIAYYGTLRAGGVVVPMNTMFKEREVDYVLSDSGARLLCAEGTELLADWPGADPLAEPVERAGEDTAVILYTSGTTGRPKGAELTHASLRRNLEEVARVHRLSEATVTLGALPLFHSFGQTCSLNATLHAGGCVTLIPRFDARRVLEVIEAHGVTLMQGVPTMYAALLADPEHERFDVSSLDHCVSGGAAMPVELMRAFEDAFGCPVLEGYGLSETSPVASTHRLGERRKPGSIGRPIDGVEMAIVDERDGIGEIVIRGHNLMKGYWNRPDATAETVDPDGWFHTGDLGRVDEDGYFYVVDRKKHMIIRGGYNVYPREIEEVLYEHRAVREAAVLGVPHPELGEEVAAAVALHAGATATPEELREFVRDRLAAYKYPRHVWIVDELPKGPTGKILKREIATPEVAAK